MAKVTSGTAFRSIVLKAFKHNQRILTGRPHVIAANAAPVANTDTAQVGTLWWHASGANDAGDAYICTVAAGTWVKINA